MCVPFLWQLSSPQDKISNILNLIRWYFFGGGLFETPPKGLPFSPSWPAAHYVDQAGLELTEICMPLPPESWD